MNYVEVEKTNGSRGVLAFLWNDNIDVDIISWSRRMIHCGIQPLGEGLKWFLTEVYGSTYHRDKHQLWNELYALKDQTEGPWLIIGDFNALLNSYDKSGGRHIGNSNDVAFIGFMNDWGELI